MAEYIIYSGGGSGFRLYAESPAFPQEYKPLVEGLYTSHGIVAKASAEGDKQCIRFAQLRDRYLLSFIYKDCDSPNESRKTIATVNWLFTADEANVLLDNNIKSNFATIIKNSENILVSNGYVFEPLPPLSRRTNLTYPVARRQALVAAAYFSSNTTTELPLSQMYIGCNRNESLLDPLFWLMYALPNGIRKKVGFHIGMALPAETFGAALVLTYNDILESVYAGSNFNGAMSVPKIILLDDRFTAEGGVPPVVQQYVALAEEDKLLLKNLLQTSSNGIKMWKCAELIIKAPSSAQLFDIDFIETLGDERSADCVKSGFFADDMLLTLQQDPRLAPYPLTAKLVDRFANDIREQRRTEELAAKQAEKERKLREAEEKKAEKERKKQEAAAKKAEKAAKKKQRRKNSKDNETDASPKHDTRPSLPKKVRKMISLLILIAIATILWLATVLFALFSGIRVIDGSLQTDLSLWKYVGQIVLVSLVNMPLGYLLIASFKELFSMKK